MGLPNGKSRVLLPILVTVVSLYILISGAGNLRLLQQYSPLLRGKAKSSATSSVTSTTPSTPHSTSFLDSVCRPGTKSSSDTPSFSSCIHSYSEGLARLIASYRPKSSQQPANDENERRLTGVAVWNNDGFKEHLRQFIYSAQLNEDVFDLIFINRKMTNEAKCVDFERHNVTIKPGGNVRVICMSNEEWWRRHADFLCSRENGWGCNIRQYQSVYQALLKREDVANMEYKPFRGYVAHDLFPRPSNSYWAWLDTDLSLGRLTHFPFNLLKPVSALLAVQQDWMYMGGQFTSFNKNDKALATEWKRIPEMRSVDAFLASSMDWQEEGWWSRNLLRSDEGSYGDALSWVALPNVHGYDHELKGSETNTSFLISGRDVLEVDPTMSRLAMEAALLISRTEAVDDQDSTGWNNILHTTTAAADEQQQEYLPLKEDKDLSLADSTHDFVQFHKGEQCGTHFWYGLQNAQCIPHHPLETTWPPMMRASYVHLKKFPPGSIHRILAPDSTPRGYNRKQFAHYFITKNTLELPPFHIDDTMAMLINQDRVEVFQMGSDRGKTFYRRRKDKSGSIG